MISKLIRGAFVNFDFIFKIGGSPEYGRTAERHENGFGVRQGRDGAAPRFDYEESAVGAGGRFGGEPSRSIGGGRAPGQRFGGQSGAPVQSRGSRGVVDATDGPQEGAVLMVYGLNMEKMNADRLFNLLCLYGNVFKVKTVSICPLQKYQFNFLLIFF